MTNMFILKNRPTKFSSFAVALKQFQREATMHNQESEIFLNVVGKDEYTITNERTKQTVRSINIKDLEPLTKILYNRNIERAQYRLVNDCRFDLDQKEYIELAKEAATEAAKILTITYYLRT
jgi:hypothetical protein